MALPSTYVKGFHDDEVVGRMEYRRFGHTGMVVSKLAIGGATFSDLFGPVDEDEAIATIHHAIREGINYIDTAPFYGQGQSEEIIGRALRTIPRRAYYIATKVGRYEKNPKYGFDYSAERTRKSIEQSLKLLGVDYLDLVQIHDIEFAPNLDQILNETLPVLEEYKREGIVQHIGVSAYPVEILKEIITRAPGRFDTVLSYSRYSLADDELLKYIPFFEEQKVGVVSAAVHAVGLLTNQGPPERHVASQELKDVCAKAAALCKENNIELAKLALYYASQVEGVTMFLVGVKNRSQLDVNLDAIINGLTEKEKNILKTLKDEYFTQNWNWEGVEVRAAREGMNGK